MKRQAIFTVLWVAPIAILCGCAEDTGGEWTTEVWPESTVQANYCTDMPHDDLEEPEVVRQDEDTWAINYPVFRDGCGAYQLLAEVWFYSERPGDSAYTYDVSVCNRCEKTQALYSLTGTVDTRGEEPKESLKKLPKSPDIQEATSMQSNMRPVVEHFAAEERILQENVVCTQPKGGEQLNVVRTPTVSYEEIDQYEIEPNEVVAESPSDGLVFRGVRLLRLVEEPVDGTRLRWPRLRPLEGPVDGRIAAGRLEYCAVNREVGGYGYGSVLRAYEIPYDVDKKYMTQTVTPPTLPDELVKRLEEGAQK